MAQSFRRAPGRAFRWCDVSEAATLAEMLSAEIWPLIAPRLRGKPPEVQSAVLADLTAKWVLAHYVPGNPAEQAEFRRQLLQDHIELIRDLVEIADRERMQ